MRLNLNLYFNMEFVVAQIQWFVDWLERFKINNNFLFSSAIFTKNSTSIENKTIGWSLVIQFEPYKQLIRGKNWLLLSLADVMAVKTDFLFTLDLMLVAVPISSLSILLTSEIAFLAGIIKEIMLVPFLSSIKLDRKTYIPFSLIKSLNKTLDFPLFNKNCVIVCFHN